MAAFAGALLFGAAFFDALALFAGARPFAATFAPPAGRAGGALFFAAGFAGSFRDFAGAAFDAAAGAVGAGGAVGGGAEAAGLAGAAELAGGTETAEGLTAGRGSGLTSGGRFEGRVAAPLFFEPSSASRRSRSPCSGVICPRRTMYCTRSLALSTVKLAIPAAAWITSRIVDAILLPASWLISCAFAASSAIVSRTSAAR